MFNFEIQTNWLGKGVLEVKALLENETVGAAYGSVIGETAVLDTITVNPPLRRNGVGTKILEAFVAAAADEAAAAKLTGDFSPEFGDIIPALTFYQGLGIEITDGKLLKIL